MFNAFLMIEPPLPPPKKNIFEFGSMWKYGKFNIASTLVMGSITCFCLLFIFLAFRPNQTLIDGTTVNIIIFTLLGLVVLIVLFNLFDNKNNQ